MATETLKINITATNKDAVDKIKQTVEGLDGVTVAAKKTGEGLNKLPNTTNQATNALSNLGRVAQDAPFGFMAIQNNLNPLLESFQRLQAESGSTSSALKSIASSLIGPAGIGLALSVAGALFVKFGDQLFSASEESKRAAESQKKYNEELSKSVGNAREEITELQILIGIVNNHTESIDTRKRALAELKEKYKGNVELQKIDIEDQKKLTDLSNQLSAAIYRKAKANAFANLIAEEEAKKAKLQNQTSEEMIDKVGKMDKAWNKLMGLAQGLSTGNYKFYTSLEDSKDALEIQNGELKQTQKNLDTYNQLLKTNTEEQIRNNDAATTGNKVAVESKKTSAVKRTAAAVEKIESYKPINTRQQGTILEPKTAVIDPTTIRLKNSEQLNQVLAQQAIIQDENNKKIEAANMLTNVSMDLFNGLANAIANGQNIGDALGNTFKKLAIDIAAAAAKALIFQAILGAVTGGTSMAAGGGGFGKIFGSLLGFASGGTATGPQSGYPVMLHGTESIVRPDQMNKIIAGSAKMGQNMSAMQQPNMGGQFVLRGSDLVLATQRANYSLNLRRG